MVTWLALPFFLSQTQPGRQDPWQMAAVPGVGLAGREHGEQALQVRQKACSVEWEHEPTPPSSCLRCVLGSSCKSDFGLGLSYNGSGKDDLGESKATSASEATVKRREWGTGLNSRLPSLTPLARFPCDRHQSSQDSVRMLLPRPYLRLPPCRWV